MSLTEYLGACYDERCRTYQQTVVGAFPDIRDIRERVVWGSFSWSLVQSRIRLLRRSTAVSIGFGLQSPGDVVRDYLDYYHPRRLRASATQAREITRHVTTPLFIRPTVDKDYTYVDIKSAYWSILRLVGWNVDYFPQNWLVRGRIPIDFPLADHKVARACLVSLGLPASSLVWTGEHFCRRRTRNVHLNMGLWRVVQDILHSIAAAALALEAVYVHTDGYILPTRHAEALQDEIRSWGLPSTIKGSGFTMVLGFGNFAVGERRSKRLRPIIGKPYRYVLPVDTAWLKKRIFRLRLEKP
jgi:hypothetical protein